MPDNVYANGREVSCKAGDGKTICAFPDVCFTPPENPATPPGVPIPYPNTGIDGDTTEGSKTVKITGKEVMLKDKSYFKKSMGDEAGCATKKGILTSVNRGKVYFNSWSMDVKFESENVVRHLDLTTHNHASKAGDTPTWPFAKGMARSKDPCKKEKKNEETACEGYKPTPEDGEDVCEVAGLQGEIIQEDAEAVKAGKKAKTGWKSAEDWAADMAERAGANKCIQARRCKLVPYDAEKDGIKGCCPSQTPDHLIPKSSFFKKSFSDGKKVEGWEEYNYKDAPCMCAEGASNTAGSHGLRHAYHKAEGPEKDTEESFNEQVTLAVDSACAVFLGSGCTPGCIEAQLKEGHKGMGDRRKKIRHSPSGSEMHPDDITAQAAVYSSETAAP